MASRTKRLYIRISNQEYAEICRNAKAAGLNLSNYARKILTGEVVKPAKPIDYFQLFNEINKIGVNINQIAKAANIGGSVSDGQISQTQFLLTKIYDRLDAELS